MTRIRPLHILLVAAALAVAAGTVARPAEAAKPACWKTLLNDWYDGRIDNIYPRHCYGEALRHLPTDVQVYSSAHDDIERALQAAIAGKHAGPNRGSGPKGGGRGSGPTGGGSTVRPAPAVTNGRRTKNGPFGAVADRLNPGSADSLPVPLLILGGLAILLVLAGLAGLVARRRQSPDTGV